MIGDEHTPIPGFEHDRLDPESHVLDDDHDPLLALAEARQAHRATIIDRLLQACVFAVYGLGIAVLVLSIAFFGVSRRADRVVKNQEAEAVFREQVRAALTCLTDRSRCTDDQLRATLDALALNRVPPPIPAVSPTSRPPAAPLAPSPAAPGSPATPPSRPPTPAVAPTEPAVPRSPPTTPRPAPTTTTQPCPTVPILGTCLRRTP